MKKALKIIGYLVLTLIVLLVVAFFSFNQKRPVGVKGEKAEALAQKMMQAVNKSAWDTTAHISWTTRDGKAWIWDKKRNFAQLEWKNNKVLLDINKISGKVWTDKIAITDPVAAQKLIQKAYESFINDAFWLNPVVKFYDDGVERSLVTLADGREGLLVSYTSGGVTPGDAYLWLADANGLPTAWQMWVKILPLGGLEFSWGDWITLPSGAKVATLHKAKGLGLAITKSNIKSETNLGGLSEKTGIFSTLE
jgi:hypothetical protein